MAFQDKYWIALKRHDLLSDRIYQVYSWYIPCIYYAYSMRWSLASTLSCPAALGSLRPGLPSELFSFGHREAAHTRLGPSKVPQPGVDLVNMAAPPWGRASTIGTAALKSVLLSVAVLMWKSVNFIQALGGNSLWRKRRSASLTCQEYFTFKISGYSV
jgi:hypothetical protein